MNYTKYTDSIISALDFEEWISREQLSLRTTGKATSLDNLKGHARIAFEKLIENGTVEHTYINRFAHYRLVQKEFTRTSEANQWTDSEDAEKQEALPEVKVVGIKEAMDALFDAVCAEAKRQVEGRYAEEIETLRARNKELSERLANTHIDDLSIRLRKNFNIQ